MPTAEDVLRQCQACGRTGTFSISEHAHARSRIQGHSRADLVHALTHAARCQPVDEGAGGVGKWEVRGPSLAGTEVTLFVVLGADALSVV